MSVDKLVDSAQLDADLTSVANAIRAKSGGSGSLSFPSGFVSEIGNISGGGSSGATLIASGTYTGTGGTTATIPVGRKMASTDFIFLIAAQDESEFAYGATYKILGFASVVDKTLAKFDLSTDGTKAAAGQNEYSYDNSGTVTALSWSGLSSGTSGQRNTGVNPGGTNNYPKIVRGSSGFSIEIYHGGQWPFPSGIVYDWKIVYYGNDPTNDIVEVSV